MRPNQEPRIKRQEDFLWFKLLDRFGLPTVAFLIMLLFMLRESERQAIRIDEERKDNRIVLQSIADSLNANTKILQAMSSEVHELGDRTLAIERKIGIQKGKQGE